MEKSESIKEIGKALIQFHLKVDKIKKDASNPFFKSKYASLSNIQEAVSIPLTESGLAYSQFPDGEHGLTTIIIHAESGEWMQATYKMKPAKDDPQGVGSVITYQKRYALAAALALTIDDDDDANTGTHGGKTPEDAKDNQKPWLNENTKEFTGAIEKLRKGETTIAKIEQYFKLSKTIKTKLNQAIIPANAN